ncbi:MAG: ferrous iron transporter B [Anaerolineae bacterium]|nr:ferrous iron transporter B [Anaerolineae bacterium]
MKNEPETQQRCLAFVKKAGTLILVVSVVVWILSALPDGEIETSYLAQIGHALEPLGRLMGFDWRLMVALLTSFVAKENSIATLGVLFGSTGLTAGGAGEEAGLAATMAVTFSPATALAFFIPCVAAVAVVRQETNSWKWTLFNVGFLLLVSWAVGVGVYWLACLVGL